jgi:hypothetical protein
MARILLNLDTKPFSPYRGGREGGLEGHFMDEVMNPDDKKTQPMSKQMKTVLSPPADPGFLDKD